MAPAVLAASWWTWTTTTSRWPSGPETGRAARLGPAFQGSLLKTAPFSRGVVPEQHEASSRWPSRAVASGKCFRKGCQEHNEYAALRRSPNPLTAGGTALSTVISRERCGVFSDKTG
jgi:hypothetical protein